MAECIKYDSVSQQACLYAGGGADVHNVLVEVCRPPPPPLLNLGG